MVKRAIPVGGIYRKMNWWDQLLWRYCTYCQHHFKREGGWKAGPFNLGGGSPALLYTCLACCPTIDDADRRHRGEG